MKSRPSIVVLPRMLTLRQAACLLGISESYLSAHLDLFQESGFPRRDPLVANRFDRKAIEAWLDERSGLAARLAGMTPSAAYASDPDPVMEAMHGIGQHALRRPRQRA